jgi:uncharacterized protein
MHVGILQFELLIHDAASLKDKRRIVKSVKDRLHREHLVSVAEVAALEVWNVAVMGLAAVSRDPAYLNVLLERIVTDLRSLRDAELGDVRRDVLSGDQLPEQGEPSWTEEDRRPIDTGAGPGAARA